jgi:Na+/melibiose symporter-like transporter
MSFSALVEAIAQDGPDSNRKGLFSAAYTAMEKAMIAVGGFAVAIALSVSHFNQAAGPDGQTPFTLHAIVFTLVFVPVVLKLLSLVVLSRADKRPIHLITAAARVSPIEAAE